MRNSLKKGSVRTIIFKEGGTWYGVALEFNIVESGDDPREVMIYLDEAIRGYIESARRVRLGAGVLNQKVNAEYEKLWTRAQQNKPIRSPLKLYSVGSTELSSITNNASRD